MLCFQSQCVLRLLAQLISIYKILIAMVVFKRFTDLSNCHLPECIGLSITNSAISITSIMRFDVNSQRKRAMRDADEHTIREITKEMVCRMCPLNNAYYLVSSSFKLRCSRMMLLATIKAMTAMETTPEISR